MLLPRTLAVPVLAAALSAFAPAAHATTLVARPLDAMVREADAVAVVATGALPPRAARWVDGRIVTRLEVTVLETLRGALPTGPLALTLPGGTVGGVTQHLAGAPEFGPGGAWVVLLRRLPDGTFTVAGLCLGQLPVTLDPVTRLATVGPPAATDVTVVPDPRAPAPVASTPLAEVPAAGMRLDAFAALVRAVRP